MNPEFINIAAYKFIDLDDLAGRKASLLPFCKSLDLKGTILLSLEGINMFLAGTRDSIDRFLDHLRAQPEFEDIEVKESVSDHQPFSRMLVRLKKEIISMGVEVIRPVQKTSPKISAQTLKQWLDEGKDVALLDVRNDYEIEVGTFKNAIPAGVDHFRQFPAATRQLPESMKQKPVVMFCTGGIRCEKAGPLMENEGFKEIFQLDGGILKYFEECGGEHYEGDCFVFDKRVAVDPDLNETEFEQCYGCQAVLTAEDQASELYQPPYTCPYCFRTPQQKQKDLLEERNNLVALRTTPQPGCVPYNNIRPMNVPLRFDKALVIDFLCGMHAHLSREYWEEECKLERIVYKSNPISANDIVRSGWRVEHLIPHTVEPPVNNAVEFLYEDDVLIAVNKPAPLPMHPCGRFNRNTLNYFVNLVFTDDQVRLLHRLDANTTGVVILAKKKSAARKVQPQFENGTVTKTYLARIHGIPESETFQCDARIGASPELAGARAIDEHGLPALTKFKVVNKFDDGTTLVECYPKTGRTNQIRLHLAHLGYPISGDPTYCVGGEVQEKQALSVDDPPMCLHAWKLVIEHPTTGEPVELVATPPSWSQ